jgi:hypothetical protein
MLSWLRPQQASDWIPQASATATNANANANANANVNANANPGQLFHCPPLYFCHQAELGQ